MRGGALLLLVARLVSAATTLAVLAIAGRVDPVQLGAVGVGAAAGAIGAALVDAGTSSLLIRNASRRPGDVGHLLGFGLCVETVTGPAILLATMAVLASVFGAAWPVMFAMAAALVVQQTAELSRACFISGRRFRIAAGHSIVENVAWLGVVAAMIAAGAPLAEALVAGVAVMAGSVAVGLVLVRLLLGTRPLLPRISTSRQLLGALRPFVAFNVLGVAYGRVDTILVGALVPASGLALAGVYFTAARLMATAEFVPDAVARSLYPEVARAYAGDPRSVNVLVRPALGILLAFALPVPVVFAISGDAILRLLIGPAGAGAGLLAAGLALAVPIRSISYLLGMSLTSADAQGRRVLAAGSALVLVGLVDAIFLPLVGIPAAVVGSFVAAAAVALVYVRSFAARFGRLDITTDVARTVAASALAAAPGALASALLGPWPAIAVFAFAYLLVTAAVNPTVITTLRRSSS